MRTLHDSLTQFIPSLSLERVFLRGVQRAARIVIGVATILILVAAIIAHNSSLIPVDSFLLLGLGLVALSIWLSLLMLYSYHNYYYFFALNSIIGIDDNPVSGTTYDVADTILDQEDDLTKAFVTSKLGEQVLLRAGLTVEILTEYVNTKRPLLKSEVIPAEEAKVFTLVDLAQMLLVMDKSFKELLKSNGVSDDTFYGSLSWVIGSHLSKKRRERWWSKDALSRVQGIGRELSYGRAYHLERYARNISTSAVFSKFGGNSPYIDSKVEEIESVLARAKAANVLLVGEAGVGKMDLVIAVAKRMMAGKSLQAIAGKHVIVLDTDRLLALNQTKAELEVALLKLFGEARHAGNLIVVIENLGQFIKETEALGVFMPELLDEFLASPEINVIATDTPGSYHTILQPKGALVRRFSEILIEPSDTNGSLSVLLGLAESNERKYHTFFTYPAVMAIVKAADQYLVEGVMPDKAVGLLLEIASKADQDNVAVITPDFVYTHISKKTGIPAGPIKEEERDVLLNLEAKLHNLVIGQDAALSAVAKTMRRARAGIQQTDKPIGSFLFLGPTGVGKTETAKALATVFFGSAENLRRIDMSEYSADDALERLTGDGQQAGTLPTILTEHPYCVLLLDEFEKAAVAVHDLFLQILDEGVFTSARGDRINARNTIIIATSNAGSALIIKTVEQRKALATLHDEIINHIIAQGMFRPELINRFDNTIIFEPLTREEQGGVAQLMLGDLYERIKGRGYELELSKDLMEVLVEKGYDPEFGARPMQRVLQDTIEEKIAQKIIAGTVKPGDTISLSKDDFLEVELTAV